MSAELNNIRLTPAIAAALYHHSLIDDEIHEVAEKKPAVIPVAGDEWKFLGANQQNILIAVSHSGITHLPDEDLDLLSSILKACKLGLADVAIINAHNYPQHTYKEYLDQFNSKIVLLFGMDPVSFGLPVDFPHFQVQSFAKTTFLYSPPLAEYDKLLKSKLWVSLKTIFKL